MNYFRALCVLVFCSINFNLSFAQNSAPEGIYYQAVARDNQGIEMTSEALSLQISIREDAEIIYTENHSVTSDQFGLFELVIGNGVAQTLESFEDITWEASQYFLDVALDSGNGFETLSETQLLSVPFSLYSTTALNVINDDVTDADANPVNELVSSFQIEEDSLKLSEAGNTYSVALSELVEDNDWTLGEDSAVYNSDQTNKVGINTENPTSSLTIDGTLAMGVLNSGSFPFDGFIELGIENSVLLCDVTDGPIQVTLPDATLCEGRIYYIKKYANIIPNSAPNIVTIQPAPGSGQTIDLQPSRLLNSAAFQEMSIISDGANWFILSRSNAQ